ncbi:hypothetical protein GJ744_006708 [Endocarpon pusillum]|uniref:Uncharacterized protein n=1 Tax=Endocarpon pusillum TaxID=364733 RepID=A0A8H7E4Q3_9EURO|nr:hypothetical protein GJ744_006708 [Endocarpon pusillum]
MSVPPAKPEYIQRAFIDPIFPALTVGAVSGAAGLIGGGFGGIVLSKHPVLFATAAGLQWFGLGSTFWYVRNVGIAASTQSKLSNGETVLHSTFAGSVAGAVNGAMRSRSNVLPGALMYGILGMLGQGVYNAFQGGGDEVEVRVPYSQRLLDSRWVPLKRLSDEDYVEMLNEKTIKIDAEIAIIDDKIAALQKSRTKGG